MPVPRRTTVVHVRDGYDVYVGRAVPRRKFKASRWGNPYRVSEFTPEHCLRRYREYVLDQPDLLDALPELVGKRLGCWCKKKGHEPCHGDVLVALLKERGLEP